MVHSFAIGAYFSTRFVATGSLWEPIALHATNNICALLVRTDVAMKNPTVLFVVSMIQSLGFYFYMSLRGLHQLDAKKLHSK